MMQIQRPIQTELTLRLVHDLSPDSSDSTEEEDDESLAVQRERFLLGCLARSTITNTNSIMRVADTKCDKYCDKTRTIKGAFNKLEWQQHQFEKINNHINEQHLTTVLDCTYQNMNLINNNFLQSADCECESSDKENIRPRSPPTRRSGAPTAKSARRPRKLPDIPKKIQASAVPLKQNTVNEKCLADELQEALVKTDDSVESDSDDVFLPGSGKQLPKVYPKYSGNFLEELKTVKFNSVSKNTRAFLNSDNMYLKEDSTEHSERRMSHDKTEDSRDKSRDVCTASSGKGNDGDGNSRRCSSSFPSTHYQDLVVTHRGMHRFIPRHKDELSIEIGDPIHVVKTGDDLWCEGVNLRTSQRGIFPCMYATDLGFLEEEEEDNGCSKFFLRFLGSVEVNYHKGDEILCQAINKVALSRRAMKTSLPPPICTLEVSQYGIRMFDKSKSGHENLEAFAHFFALKNITFCGHHPRNERYFAFITKHPNQYRYACHVFLGEKSTRSVTDSVGQAFKRFYQEYMAFTHPTEDIYME